MEQIVVVGFRRGRHREAERGELEHFRPAGHSEGVVKTTGPG